MTSRQRSCNQRVGCLFGVTLLNTMSEGVKIQFNEGGVKPLWDEKWEAREGGSS